MGEAETAVAEGVALVEVEAAAAAASEEAASVTAEAK